MRLTKAQFEALQPYQKHFETMVRSKWSRYPGSAALDLIHSTYVQVTGSTMKLNKGCNHCVMKLLTEMGKIFLADLEERNRAEKEIIPPVEEISAPEVEIQEAEAEIVKTEVKTKKRGGRKSKSKE